MSPKRILIVDDEPRLVQLVREILLATGYEVLAISSGAHAIEAAAVEQPDLILLDLMLPGGIDGYEAARRIREFSQVPIIMLTAKVREADMLHGFETGADDYITKPFSSKELLARIGAVLKRTEGEKALDTTEIDCGRLKIDLARRMVSISGSEIVLTPTEYKLLHELAQHVNQVMLHEQLLAAVWGPEYRDDLEYLRTYIRHLRQKIEPDPAHPSLIVRFRGVGYMLACPERAALVVPAVDTRLPAS
jgi:two-component system, OmpR family, KDP operon response regulator KdpE